MAVKKRKTIAEHRAKAKSQARAEMLAAVCRVLKWHMGHVLIAENLWELMLSGKPLRMGPELAPHVTIPPLELN